MLLPTLPRALVAAAALVLTPACVSAAKHHAALQAADEANNDAVVRAEHVRKLDEELALLELKHKTCDALLATSQATGKELAGHLERAATLEAELRAETKRKLEEARRSQQFAEARARFFQDIATRFQRMIDTGDLEVFLRDGRLVLALPNDVLFDSGRTQLKPAGRETLEQIAAVLRGPDIEGRRIQVAGHTDSVPIATSRFPSNWELSMGRAVEVVRLLLSQGVAPEALSAAGYAEHDAVAPNESAAGRARNRRIEIILQPDLEVALGPERGRPL